MKVEIILTCLLLLVSSLSFGWVTEIVEMSGPVLSTSLALDSSGNPHIVYSLGSLNGRVIYAYRENDIWSYYTLGTGGSIGTASIALDTSDYPHIAFSHFGLVYARWDGSAWQMENLDSSGNGASLILDSSENPHISYYAYAEQILRYAYWNGTAWDISDVDTPSTESSIALNSMDYPHISYYGGDYIYDFIEYAWWDGSNWLNEILEISGLTGESTISLGIDSQDHSHISFYNVDYNYLRYAFWNGSAWLITTMDSTGNTGRNSSLALDSSDNPHIAYRDDSNNDLKYAWWNGSTWSIATVCPGGENTSLILDEYGYAHISHSGGTGMVMYTWEPATEIGDIERIGLEGYSLFPLNPNPAYGNFTAQFEIPANATVSLSLYDITGRLVRRTSPTVYLAGKHQLLFSELSTGVYICQMVADSYVQSRYAVIISK